MKLDFFFFKMEMVFHVTVQYFREFQVELLSFPQGKWKGKEKLLGKMSSWFMQMIVQLYSG